MRVDVSGWVGAAPDMLDVICPKTIYSVSSMMRGGIIMLKNRDVGVVMEQRNDRMSENVIAVSLST